MKRFRWLLVSLGLVMVVPQAARGQFRDRPRDPLREAAADVVRSDAWHRELQRLELEEEATKRWAAAKEAELRADEARLEDRLRMNKVLRQQYQVAGEEAKAQQLQEKMEGEAGELQARRRAFQAELEERTAALRDRRQQLQREFTGEATPPAPDVPISRSEHMQRAVRHLAEAAEHFEAAGMRRQAEVIRDQLRDLERELVARDPGRRPEPEQPDTQRLIETIERLHERMERMEEKLEQLDDKS